MTPSSEQGATYIDLLPVGLPAEARWSMGKALAVACFVSAGIWALIFLALIR